MHPSCRHHMVFTKIKFKTDFPPAYKRKIWDFSRANHHAIKLATNSIDWDTVFEPLDIDGRVSFLTEAILNIFSNFVPNKIITIRSKDTLWMTPEVKRLLIEKSKTLCQKRSEIS